MSVVVYSLRTVLFYIVLTAWTIGWSAIMLIALPLMPFKKRHSLVKCWGHVAMLLCRLIVGIRWEVQGRENIPDTPCVLISNHQSTWETFFFQTLITPQTQVIKKSLLSIPFFGWAFSLTKPIAIDRNNPRKSLHQIAVQGKHAIDQGIWVLIFPEGTRNPNGKLGKFSRGAITLARKAECNVLPIAHNAGTCWPNNTWIKKPGTIRIHIGKEMAVIDKTPALITEESRNWIEQEISQMNKTN